MGDLDGNRKADFEIKVDGIASIRAQDFILG
jgi:hypothetical protein